MHQRRILLKPLARRSHRERHQLRLQLRRCRALLQHRVRMYLRQLHRMKGPLTHPKKTLRHRGETSSGMRHQFLRVLRRMFRHHRHHQPHHQLAQGRNRTCHTNIPQVLVAQHRRRRKQIHPQTPEAAMLNRTSCQDQRMCLQAATLLRAQQPRH